MLKMPEVLSGSMRPPQVTVRAGTLPPVTVHIFNDIACPWCHIGARRLQRSVRQYKRLYGQAAPVKVQWNPLLVARDVTLTGEDVNSYAQRRWGISSVDPIRARLVRAGLPEGAAFSNWNVMPNSLLALELLSFAADMGLAEQASNLLFTRTYEQGGNISLLDELLDIGELLGMSREEVVKELTRTDGESRQARVLEQDAVAKRRLRIQAVPYFIITAGPNCRTKYSLTGAHQTSDLLGAMERVAVEEARIAVGSNAAVVPYGTSVGKLATRGAATRQTSPVLIAT